MKFPQFSKINSHRTFDYTPMYYNAKKEEFDNRVKLIQDELKQKEENTNSEREAVLRHKFRQQALNMGYQSKTKGSSARMMIILGLILYLGYLTFTNLDNFMSILLH